jgi:hypothetical protein
LKIFSLFPSRQQLPKKKIIFIFFNFFSRIRADSKGEGGRRRRGGEGGRGEGDASARTPMSAWTLGCVCADAFFTALADGKNSSAGKTASVG